MRSPINENKALCQHAYDLLSRRLFDEAIPILEEIIEMTPSARTLSWVVAALIAAGRTKEATKRAVQASKDWPQSWETQDALGRALAASTSYEAAVRAFQICASLRRGAAQAKLPAYFALHTVEQLDYLERNVDFYPEFIHLRSDTQHNQVSTWLPDVGEEMRGGVRAVSESKAREALSVPLFIPRQTAIRQPLNKALNFAMISKRFIENNRGFVIIDDLLSTEALDSLRQFCLGATVWRRWYEPGYVGAFPEDGFASVLLFEIGDALRRAMPAVFEGHRLAQWWAFAYDQRLGGTDIHADDADMSVNLWITETKANLEQDRGGLVMWDRAAPDDWKFHDYNGDNEKVRSWLTQVAATETIIPYKANRAVLFRGHFFHRSDGTNFAPGYQNRRRNITFLFHRIC